MRDGLDHAGVDAWRHRAQGHSVGSRPRLPSRSMRQRSGVAYRRRATPRVPTFRYWASIIGSAYCCPKLFSREYAAASVSAGEPVILGACNCASRRGSGAKIIGRAAAGAIYVTGLHRAAIAARRGRLSRRSRPIRHANISARIKRHYQPSRVSSGLKEARARAKEEI